MGKDSVSSVPRRKLASELKRLVKDGIKLQLSNTEAFKRAMRILNRSYNVPSGGSQQSVPWVKPAGFDQQWWNGKLLSTRLRVRPTKREVQRATERRRKFEAMVRACERRKLLVLHRGGRHFHFTRRLRFDDSACLEEETNFNPQSEVVFSPFPNKEEEDMHHKFIEASDLARDILSRARCLPTCGSEEGESCFSDEISELSEALSKAWDLPRDSDTAVVGFFTA